MEKTCKNSPNEIITNLLFTRLFCSAPVREVYNQPAPPRINHKTIFGFYIHIVWQKHDEKLVKLMDHVTVKHHRHIFIRLMLSRPQRFYVNRYDLVILIGNVIVSFRYQEFEFAMYSYCYSRSMEYGRNYTHRVAIAIPRILIMHDPQFLMHTKRKVSTAPRIVNCNTPRRTV